jgi:hypothetical protein
MKDEFTGYIIKKDFEEYFKKYKDEDFGKATNKLIHCHKHILDFDYYFDDSQEIDEEFEYTEIIEFLGCSLDINSTYEDEFRIRFFNDPYKYKLIASYILSEFDNMISLIKEWKKFDFFTTDIKKNKLFDNVIQVFQYCMQSFLKYAPNCKMLNKIEFANHLELSEILEISSQSELKLSNKKKVAQGLWNNKLRFDFINELGIIERIQKLNEKESTKWEIIAQILGVHSDTAKGLLSGKYEKGKDNDEHIENKNRFVRLLK